MSNSVSVINGTTDSKIKDIDLGPNLQPMKIIEGFPWSNVLFSGFGKPNNIFVGSHILNSVGSNGRFGGNVSVISGTNDTKAHDIRLGHDPTAIGVGVGKIYVANGLSVSVINPCNGKTQDVLVGNKPTAVAVLAYPEANTTTGYPKIYVANHGPSSGTVSVINDFPSNATKEAHDIPVGRDPEDIAVGPPATKHTGYPKIYVANTLSNTVSVINSTTDTKEPARYPCRLLPQQNSI